MYWQVKVLAIRGLMYRHSKAIETSLFLEQICRTLDTTKRFSTADKTRVRTVALRVGTCYVCSSC